MILFYVVHYPKPEKEELLIERMHEFGNLLRSLKGIVWVNPYPFKDPENGTLVAISIWESEEAFNEALPDIPRGKSLSPGGEFEEKPRERYVFLSAR